MKIFVLTLLCAFVLHNVDGQRRRQMSAFSMNPRFRAPPRPNGPLRKTVASLRSAMSSKSRQTVAVISEIARAVEQFGFRPVSMSALTRAIVGIFVTGRPMDVGYQRSLSASSAETISQTLLILNSLSAEQMSILKSTLARIIGFRYQEHVETKLPPPPKYEVSPEVKTALEHALSTLRQTQTGNANSEKILSDIVKYATSAEANSNIPTYLSSSAKIVVDAFVSRRRLKPGHPSTPILNALRSLPEEEAHALMSQFMKIIAFNPTGNTGIVEGISDIVMPEIKPVKKPVMPPLQDIIKKISEETNQHNSTGPTTISPYQLEEQRRVEAYRAQQMRRLEEINNQEIQAANRRLEIMNVQSQNTVNAEKERLRQITKANHQSFQAFQQQTERRNSRPLDMSRHIWNMNSNLLSEHGSEATRWLQDAAQDKVILDYGNQRTSKAANSSQGEIISLQTQGQAKDITRNIDSSIEPRKPSVIPADQPERRNGNRVTGIRGSAPQLPLQPVETFQTPSRINYQQPNFQVRPRILDTVRRRIVPPGMIFRPPNVFRTQRPNFPQRIPYQVQRQNISPRFRPVSQMYFQA